MILLQWLVSLPHTMVIATSIATIGMTILTKALGATQSLLTLIDIKPVP